MALVLLDISMSLDGMVALPNDDPGPIQDWLFTGDTTNSHHPDFKTSGASTDVFDELFETVGAIVTGKHTYDITNGWDGNHPVHGAPIFVVTHAVPDKVSQGPTKFVFVTDGVNNAVEQAKAAAGDKVVYVLGGATIAQECMKLGLLDEIQLHVASVIVGQGVPLFDPTDMPQIKLEDKRLVEAPGVTHVLYRVVK